MNCNVYRGVKLLEHAMKVVEKILDYRLILILTIDDMQCGFMSVKVPLMQYLKYGGYKKNT